MFNLFDQISDGAKVSNDATDIRDASHIVLPGVGAFGAAMRKIRERIPIGAVESEVASGKPLLGICVGMQVMADVGTEFGDHRGLGSFRAAWNGSIRTIVRCRTLAGTTFRSVGATLYWRILERRRISISCIATSLPGP